MLFAIVTLKQKTLRSILVIKAEQVSRYITRYITRYFTGYKTGFTLQDITYSFTRHYCMLHTSLCSLLDLV